MRLVLTGLVTASIAYDQDRRRGVDLDVYVRMLAVSVVFRDQNGRRVEPLRGEGAA